MTALPVTAWQVARQRAMTKIHIRFDYAVAHGAGTLCGRRIPARAINGTTREIAPTCKKCLEQLVQL